MLTSFRSIFPSVSQAVVQALGVDAIPHFAFVTADGTVQTSFIGMIPPRVLREEVRALSERRPLPYRMVDVYDGLPSHRLTDYLRGAASTTN